MTTDLARSWMDDVDELPAEIPGASNLEPGRLAWLHGVSAGGAKTPGVFYGKDTAFVEPPPTPWVVDERHENELGYSCPELRLAFIANRSQWFIPGETKDDLSTWLLDYQEGAKKLTEYLVLIDGIVEPMVLAVSGKYKAGPIAQLLSDYRRGALAQAMRKTKRNLPAWAFWLPIANKRDKNGKTEYVSAKDSDGKDYNSVVTPPTLIGAPIPVSKEMLLYGAELWQQYQDWAKAKRMPHDGNVSEASYTVEPQRQLPPPKNLPVALTEEDYPPEEIPNF